MRRLRSKGRDITQDESNSLFVTCSSSFMLPSAAAGIGRAANLLLLPITKVRGTRKRRIWWFDLHMDLATLHALIVRAVAFLAAQPDEPPRRMQAPVGERVRRVRRAHDVTQERLAELSGLNVITISRLEKGTAKAVYADTVAALARALGVSADYLLGLSDKEDGHV